MARKRTRICQVCGRQFEASVHNKKYCSAECQYQAKLRAAREYERRRRRETLLTDKGRFIVVRDALPQEEGGFPPGAQFRGLEVRVMLRNGALLPGTLFRREPGGVLLQVVENGGRLKTRRVENAAHGEG